MVAIASYLVAVAGVAPLLVGGTTLSSSTGTSISPASTGTSSSSTRSTLKTSTTSLRKTSSKSTATSLRTSSRKSSSTSTRSTSTKSTKTTSLSAASATALSQRLINRLNGYKADALMTTLLQVKASTQAQAQVALNNAGYAGLNMGDALSLYPMQPNTLLANMTCFLKYPPSVAAIEANTTSPPCPVPGSVFGGSLSGTYSIDSPDSLSDVAFTFDGEDLLAQWITGTDTPSDTTVSAVSVDKNSNPWTYTWASNGKAFRARFNADLVQGTPTLTVKGTVDGQAFSGTLNVVAVDPNSLAKPDSGATSKQLAIGFGVGLPCLAFIGGLIWRVSSDKEGGTIEDYVDKVNAEIAKLKERVASNPDDTDAQQRLEGLEKIGQVAEGTTRSLQDARKGLVIEVPLFAAAGVAAVAEMQRASQVAAEKIVNAVDLGDYLNTPATKKEFEQITKNVLASSIKEALADGSITEKDVINYDPQKIAEGDPESETVKAWGSVNDKVDDKLVEYFGSTVRSKLRENAELKPLLTAKVLTPADYKSVVQSGVDTLYNGPAGELAAQYGSLGIVEYGRTLIKQREKQANADLKTYKSLTTKAASKKVETYQKQVIDAHRQYEKYKEQDAQERDPVIEKKLREQWKDIQKESKKYAESVTEAVSKTAEAKEALKENKEGKEALDGTEKEAKKQRKNIEAAV